MQQDLQGERLVLIVIEGLPGDSPTGGPLESLFPADLTARGMWAQLTLPVSEPTETGWEHVATDGEGDVTPFWR